MGQTQGPQLGSSPLAQPNQNIDAMLKAMSAQRPGAMAPPGTFGPNPMAGGCGVGQVWRGPVAGQPNRNIPAPGMPQGPTGMGGLDPTQWQQRLYGGNVGSPGSSTGVA